MTSAYAVIEDEKIDIRTVSLTRQAAIINWLVTKKKIMIYNSDTIDDIEIYWDRHHGNAKVERISLSRKNQLQLVDDAYS